MSLEEKNIDKPRTKPAEVRLERVNERRRNTIFWKRI